MSILTTMYLQKHKRTRAKSTRISSEQLLRYKTSYMSPQTLYPWTVTQYTFPTPYYIVITDNYNETLCFSRTTVVFKTITWEFPAKTLTYAMSQPSSCAYLPVTVENSLSFQFCNTFGPLQWVRSERPLREEVLKRDNRTPFT